MLSKASSFLGPSSVFNSNSLSSLVLYLDAGNTQSYNGGLNWYDLSSYHNNGTFQSTPTYSNVWNGVIGFESSNYVTFSGLTGIPIGNSNYTIEAWVQNNNPNSSGGIIGWGSYGASYGVNALRYSGSGGFSNYWWGDDISTDPLGMTNSIYYHIVSKWNGVNREIWFNGTMSKQDVPSATHSVPYSNNLTIGVSNIDLNEYLNGRIGFIKVYNKALSSSRITSNFNNTKSRFGYQYGSFIFDENNSYLSSTSPDYGFGIGDFTLEGYFNHFTSSNSSYNGIISTRNFGGSGLNINLQGANTTPMIEFWTGASIEPDLFTASNNKWYHVAISRVGGTSSFYVNGKLFKSLADSTNYTTSDLVIGRYYTNTDEHYFSGIISNVRIIKGVGIYANNFSVPSTPLSNVSNTKLLLLAQRPFYLTDFSNSNTVVNNNGIGWTSSLPNVYYFNYDGFASTNGLTLVNTFKIMSNQIYLTRNIDSQVGNVYASESIRFDRNFSFEWNFECSGGSGADGFCLQWTTTNNSNGGPGGEVGRIDNSSTINALSFRTYYDSVKWFKNNIESGDFYVSSDYLRQNLYYWLDYIHNDSILNLYIATYSTKPASPSGTFSSFTFDSTPYYIGFGAATGASNDYHILKSMRLLF